MWTCPKCERKFKTTNQSHWCGNVSLDELFYDKPDELLLAFDTLTQVVSEWEPCSIGTSVRTVVLTNKKAWLIVKPMSKELDIKFYNSKPLDSPLIKRIADYRNKYAHHIRVKNEFQITKDLIELLRVGFDYALE